MKTLKIQVFGLVQGVSFRFYAKEKAEELGIKGWVKNQEDGSVLIVAQGKEKSLKDFLSWCYEGSPLAKVEKVEAEELKDFKEEFKDFQIRF